MREGCWGAGLPSLLAAALMLLWPSLSHACTITHAPDDSTNDTVVFNVRMKAGERCVIHGDGKDEPWFRQGEKMSAFSTFKGHHKRLIHELHNRHNPKRARWQYVYVSPKGWTGQDMVGISFAMPPINNLYYIVVTP
jgi:hypothetical protein